MWKFVQKTGYLYQDDVFKGAGYSGHGVGYLNSNAESLVGIGPIPTGLWTIGLWEKDHLHLGPIVACLTPDNESFVFGRSGFFIHGDNQNMNHSASDGCIILSLFLRELIRDSGDTKLTVISGDQSAINI